MVPRIQHLISSVLNSVITCLPSSRCPALQNLTNFHPCIVHHINTRVNKHNIYRFILLSGKLLNSLPYSAFHLSTTWTCSEEEYEDTAETKLTVLFLELYSLLLGGAFISSF